MIISEFVEITSEIEKFYDKELTLGQRNIWFEELKNINKERYRQISREIYKTQKFMPKLADIIEINKNLPSLTSSDDGKICECKRCNSTGIIIYKKIVDGYTYDFGARCNCKNGLKLSKTIPSINEIGITI